MAIGVNRLLEAGLEDGVILFLYWKHLTKEDRDILSFGECQSMYKIAPPGSFEKKELWLMLKGKAKAFEDLCWICLKASPGLDEMAAWENLQKTAKTFEDWGRVFEFSNSILKRVIAWKELEFLADTLKELVWLWNNAWSSCQKPLIWQKIIKELETPEDVTWLALQLKSRK